MTEDQEFTDAERQGGIRYVWECAIGGRDPVTIPPGGDLPMRRAVERAFREVTGTDAEYTYSGWGRKFTSKALMLGGAYETALVARRPRTLPWWVAYVFFLFGVVIGVAMAQ